MMNVLFLILMSLACFHFVYEGIIAPSLRLRLRFKLFEQRDLLRNLRVVESKSVDKEVFSIVHDRLNNGLKLLSAIHVSTLVENDRVFDRNPELRELVQKKNAVLEACECKDVKDIDERGALIVTEAFAVNSMGLAVFVIPLIGALICFHEIVSKVAGLLLLPPKQINEAINFPHKLAMT
jgi:hypothetical protein